MRNWPEKIIIKLVSTEGRPISNTIVHVLIESPLKNDYGLEPLLSDSNGTIELDLSTIKKAIFEAKREFPSDYAASLEDCEGVKVVIENETDLLKRVNRLQAFYPGNARRLKETVQRSDNRKVQSVVASFNRNQLDQEVLVTVPMAS